MTAHSNAGLSPGIGCSVFCRKQRPELRRILPEMLACQVHRTVVPPSALHPRLTREVCIFATHKVLSAECGSARETAEDPPPIAQVQPHLPIYLAHLLSSLFVCYSNAACIIRKRPSSASAESAVQILDPDASHLLPIAASE